jgi:D-alanyl-D-alanine carboxypeptidase
MRTTILTIAGVIALAAPAAATAGTDRDALQRDAEAIVQQGAPGVLAEVDTPRGDVRVRAGLGDVEAGTPVPWDAHFRIGSFTKTYVAATVLQLVGEGRLSLDDTVDRWLPGVVEGNGNDGRAITIRQLLQHTSGLPEYLEGFTWLFAQDTFEQRRFETVTEVQALEAAMRQAPAFAPGTSWAYSNTNYLLAGMLIERITGRSWQEEVRRRIIEPLGLHDTTAPDTEPGLPQPHAIGYERFPGPDATDDDQDYGEPIDATELNPSWGGAAGAMISTTEDGNRFLQALMRGRVLKPAQLAEMKRTVPTDDEFRENWPGARYGLGLMLVPNSCGGAWGHGGDIQGFKTRNGVTGDGSRSVVVSMNTDSFEPLPGVPKAEGDVTLDIVDDALCG